MPGRRQPGNDAGNDSQQQREPEGPQIKLQVFQTRNMLDNKRRKAAAQKIDAPRR